VQIRLFACIAGALIGVVVASPVSRSFDVSPTVSLVGCLIAGIGIGYAASILFDVFSAPSGDKNVES